MPEYLRDLAVISILAGLVFFAARVPVTAIMPKDDFIRRRNAWLLLTVASFLISNFWLFALAAAFFIHRAARQDGNRMAVFYFLIFAVPAAQTQIPGFGVINYLFAIDYLRLLILVVLLPLWIRLSSRADITPFGRTGADKLLLAFMLLATGLQLRETSFTDTLRYGFNLFVDIFLPYYAASRSLRTMQDFRDAMLAFAVAAMVLAAIAVVETLTFHLFYRPPMDRMGLSWSFLNYLPRNSMLRSAGSTGHPIALGYVMAMAIGFLMFAGHGLRPKARLRGMATLVAGFIAPFSRGPWIGGATLLASFIFTGSRPVGRLLKITLMSILAIAVVSVLPGGHVVTDLLPFIGNTDEVNVQHRENLVDAAYVVVLRNPLFGSVNFGAAPEIQALLLGGIIDIVNTYVLLALEIGLVGMGLFAGVFVIAALAVRKALRKLPDTAVEERLLGRVLLSSLLATMVIIFTTSSITVIPVIYWSLAGMAVAYARAVPAWAKMAQDAGRFQPGPALPRTLAGQ